MSAHAAAEPTRKARELAEHLKQAIGDYRMRDAKVTDQDVQMAIKLLQTSSANELRVALAIIAACVGAFVTVGLGIAASKGRLGGGASSPIIWVSIGLAITGTVLGVILGRRSE
ncbi:MAG: hypothetical protein JNJ98_20275 [Gemmatimonadetes bacterium]|nr:hypothetical protein [Gemmatimonadota bacterium]